MTCYSLLFQVGLRYNEKANDPGAQTERRGEAGPVSVLLRGWDSPAAFFLGLVSPQVRPWRVWLTRIIQRRERGERREDESTQVSVSANSEFSALKLYE